MGNYMKNQYVGDIGDYTKLGMLRAIQAAGFSLGLNWYLTPNDGKTDGIHVNYLDKPCDTPDNELYYTLKAIVTAGSRSVAELENRTLPSATVFYNRMLDFSDFSDKKVFRNQWHNEALAVLQPQDVIFLDPDNGLEVKSCTPHSLNGNRYATYQEAADYFRSGASVIIYNHRDRSPEDKYLERFLRFKDIAETENADFFYVRASRFSVRDYLFIAQNKHTLRLKASIDAMLKTGWNKYLSYRDF